MKMFMIIANWATIALDSIISFKCGLQILNFPFQAELGGSGLEHPKSNTPVARRLCKDVFG
jgi:hypothetical protein